MPTFDIYRTVIYRTGIYRTGDRMVGIANPLQSSSCCLVNNANHMLAAVS